MSRWRLGLRTFGSAGVLRLLWGLVGWVVVRGISSIPDHLDQLAAIWWQLIELLRVGLGAILGWLDLNDGSGLAWQTGHGDAVNQPTNQPASQPSNQPTHQPSNQPSKQATNQPTKQSTSQPTHQRNSCYNPTSPYLSRSRGFPCSCPTARCFKRKGTLNLLGTRWGLWKQIKRASPLGSFGGN